MAGQSPTHAAEAAAMRAFDSALQKTEGLTLKSRRRVLAYVAGVLADHQEEVARQLAVAAGNAPANGGGLLEKAGAVAGLGGQGGSTGG